MIDLQTSLRPVFPVASVDPVAFARDASTPGAAGFGLGPVVGDDLLSERVHAALGAGTGARKPLLLGANARGFTVGLSRPGLDVPNLDFAAVLAGADLTRGTAAAVVAARVELDRPGVATGAADLRGPLSAALVRWVEAGRRAYAADRTWVYDFRWPWPRTTVATRCTELPFVWDNLRAAGVRRVLGHEPPAHLATTMPAAWVRFIHGGEPGWPAVGDGWGMRFDTDPRPWEVFATERWIAADLGSNLSDEVDPTVVTDANHARLPSSGIADPCAPGAATQAAQPSVLRQGGRRRGRAARREALRRVHPQRGRRAGGRLDGVDLRTLNSEDDLIRAAQAREKDQIMAALEAAFALVECHTETFYETVERVITTFAEVLGKNAGVLAPFMALGNADQVVARAGKLGFEQSVSCSALTCSRAAGTSGTPNPNAPSRGASWSSTACWRGGSVRGASRKQLARATGGRSWWTWPRPSSPS